MIRRTIAIALLAVLVNGGCRMCANYTDCAKPVLDGPYSHMEGRAGSILSGNYDSPMYESVAIIPSPAPAENSAELPAAE